MSQEDSELTQSDAKPIHKGYKFRVLLDEYFCNEQKPDAFPLCLSFRVQDLNIIQKHWISDTTILTQRNSRKVN